MAKNKMILEFFLGGAYFMQKCQFSNFVFALFRPTHLRALAPQGDLGS
jgi:hypothetical protein